MKRYTTEQRRHFNRYTGEVEITEKRIPLVSCCGRDVVCSEFTNTCEKCGADYNFAGQHLAPREQWGEETGEHWTDCI